MSTLTGSTEDKIFWSGWRVILNLHSVYDDAADDSKFAYIVYDDDDDDDDDDFEFA